MDALFLFVQNHSDSLGQGQQGVHAHLTKNQAQLSPLPNGLYEPKIGHKTKRRASSGRVGDGRMREMKREMKRDMKRDAKKDHKKETKREMKRREMKRIEGDEHWQEEDHSPGSQLNSIVSPPNSPLYFFGSPLSSLPPHSPVSLSSPTSQPIVNPLKTNTKLTSPTLTKPQAASFHQTEAAFFSEQTARIQRQLVDSGSYSSPSLLDPSLAGQPLSRQFRMSKADHPSLSDYLMTSPQPSPSRPRSNSSSTPRSPAISSSCSPIDSPAESPRSSLTPPTLSPVHSNKRRQLGKLKDYYNDPLSVQDIDDAQRLMGRMRESLLKAQQSVSDSIESIETFHPRTRKIPRALLQDP